MVFTEIARFAYNDGTKEDFEQLPFKMLPSEHNKYRSNIFL